MEEWRDVTQYEGYYQVSSSGRVKSLDRTIVRCDGVAQRRMSKLLPQQENKDGYLTVKLSKEGKDKRVFVHRLVAEAFIGICLDGLEVNHKDFNRKNNNVENLEIVSRLKNIEHTLLHNRHITQIRSMSGSDNPNYGNRVLSERYRSNPEAAKMAQSRPGESNGRARCVSVQLQDGRTMEFGCLNDCAAYLIAHDYTKAKSASCVATYIRKAAETSKKYLGLEFTLK